MRREKKTGAREQIELNWLTSNVHHRHLINFFKRNFQHWNDTVAKVPKECWHFLI